MNILKFYLVYVTLAIIVTILIFKYLKNKTNEERYRFVLMLAFLALASHLIKPFFFPYNTRPFPDILRKITFENICAVSALIYPIVLLTKKKIALDYITTIGMIGGFVAFLYPTEVILGDFDSMKVTYEMKLFAFDTIRFYFVHYLLFIIPAILLYYHIHTLNPKRAIFLPISILVILTIIYLNELVLEKLGWLNELHEYAGRNIFNDRNIRNSSFVFGLSDSFKGIGKFVDILVPKFLKEPVYVPVVWSVIPLFAYAPILYLGINYITAPDKANRRKIKRVR